MHCHIDEAILQKTWQLIGYHFDVLNATNDAHILGFEKVLLQFIFFKYNVTIRILLTSFYM